MRAAAHPNQARAEAPPAPHGDPLRGLYEAVRGDVVWPGSRAYELARRVWNGAIDRRPAAIVACSRIADVLGALRVARDAAVPIAVRSGGHSFAGLSVADGALVIDLARMKRIRVDPVRRTARVQAGALLGELDRETQTFGLAAPLGAVTHTGVAGLTLGGGIGWLMRKHGLAIDQLHAVQVVTAEGRLVTASADENPELFWGVRGGGGNFGIVTEFEFALNPVGPTVLAGTILWPLEQGGEVARFYRDWSATAPDELTTALVARRAPAVEFVPQELWGRPVVGVVCCYAGNLERGEDVLRPLRHFGRPVLDLCQPKPYLAHQAMFDPSFEPGIWVYMRSHDVPALSDDVVDVMLTHADAIVSGRSTVTVWQLGGALARVPDEATAFSGRRSAYTFNIGGITASAEGFAQERDWVRSFSDDLRPHQSSVYVNFLMAEGSERIREAYGAEKFDRLRRLKTTYDPDNVFRLNQNIPPA